uniref:NADAR domain-containing protein n=1 Tax=Plectus sambesii TaxID=2011161 RepID=A0A914W9E7_9BILA
MITVGYRLAKEFAYTVMLSHWRRDHKPPVSAKSSDSPQSSTTDKERSTTDEGNAEKESIYYSSEPSTSKAQLESVSSADSGKKKDGNEPPRVSLETKLGGALCVFYTNSPFSDFAPAPFILEGKYYPTIEHYFHIQMAYAFGLFKLAHTALQITDPGEFRKKLRTELKGMIKSGLFDEKIFSKWKDNNANKLMKNACRAKFDQNYQMRELLLHTGDRLLCFAAKNDKRLGVGMSEAEFLFWVKKNNITLEDLLNFFSGVTRRPRELGWNALGCALMDVRAEYLQKPSIIAEWKNAHPEKWKAPVDRRTIPLSAEEIGRLKDIQNDVEVCATHDIQDTTKGFDAAPTPNSSSTIRVNRSLLSLNVSTAASERSTSGGDYVVKIQAKVLGYKEERALDQLRQDANEAIGDAVQAIVENMLSIVSGESHNARGTLALEAAHFSPELAPNHPDEAKESYSFASGLDDTISVKILPDEKRIVVQRKNQPKRVIGSADDKVLPPAKKSRWTTGKDAATGG